MEKGGGKSRGKKEHEASTRNNATSIQDASEEGRRCPKQETVELFVEQWSICGIPCLSQADMSNPHRLLDNRRTLVDSPLDRHAVEFALDVAAATSS